MVSKFTLHTTSLPKPQYPVPVSLSSPFVMDTKVVKQASNNTKRGEFQGQREISADSGLGSVINYNSDNGSRSSSRLRSRPRNLEMVVSGRHKFQVRDLDDSFADDNVVPLALPELPSAFNTTHPMPKIRLVFRYYIFCL